MCRCLATILLMSIWYQSSAQSEPAERNATQNEITGDWRLVPVPESLQPKFFSKSPWPAPCQWYTFAPNGVLKSIEKTPAPCDNWSSAQLDDAMTHVPAVISWAYDLSPVYNKGIVIITRTDAKGYAEYWDPHMVTKAFSKNGAEFQQGDLVLYLINMNLKQIVWIRHLRRLQ
jgi:hypothetical protein